MVIDQYISVILPHLNQPEYLERTLVALKAQSYPSSHFEIIVVDNGSRPESLEAVSAMSKTYGFSLFQESEPGPGPARNTGVSQAKHDNLAFIDADCVPDPNWVGAIAKFLEVKPDAAIGGDVRILYDEPTNLTEIEAYESVFAYQQKNYIEKKNFSGTGNLAMTRASFEKVGPFRGLGVAEDRDWGQRATNLGIATLYNPEMIVFHPGRISFEDLCIKWRRHILHDLEQHMENDKASISWFANVVLVLGSIPIHAAMTLTSDRLERTGDRFKAIKCLVQIRLYRIFYMIKVLFTPKEAKNGPQWNR